jgi:pimeloyl-ACP methyl ester carboxylesterase
MTSRADVWRRRGGYFSWRPAGSDASPVEVFHVEAGHPEAPALLLVHGWPTSSIDWFDVLEGLSERFRVCALDFPGYGFSDKPLGWGYSLARDADLIEFYLSQVLAVDAVTVLAHDRGDSVALIHAARCAEGRSSARLESLILTNGNIFLPLSNLTSAQRLLLDGSSAPDALAALTPSNLAEGLGAATFTPARTAGDPEVDALAASFAHDDGINVLHETIQYLIERSSDEQAWLRALGGSPVPTTVIWGLNDIVSPVRVPAFVWDRYLMLKPGRNRLYFIPEANHYLQSDRPDAFVETLVHALDPADPGPGPINATPAAPLLVDASRQRIPSAPEILSADAS